MWSARERHLARDRTSKIVFAFRPTLRVHTTVCGQRQSMGEGHSESGKIVQQFPIIFAHLMFDELRRLFLLSGSIQSNIKIALHKLTTYSTEKVLKNFKLLCNLWLLHELFYSFSRQNPMYSKPIH